MALGTLSLRLGCLLSEKGDPCRDDRLWALTLTFVRVIESGVEGLLDRRGEVYQLAELLHMDVIPSFK